MGMLEHPGQRKATHQEAMTHSPLPFQDGYASMLASSGQSALVTSRVLGHRDPRSSLRYMHVSGQGAAGSGQCGVSDRAGGAQERRSGGRKGRINGQLAGDDGLGDANPSAGFFGRAKAGYGCTAGIWRLRSWPRRIQVRQLANLRQPAAQVL